MTILHRLSRPSPVLRVALGLYAAAVGAAAFWEWTNVADDWMTNVGTSAFFAAITITVIDRAIQAEARRRVEPLVGPVVEHIRVEFVVFVESVAVDYATTHNATYEPIPLGLLDVLDHWLAGQEKEDMPHIVIAQEGETLGALGGVFIDQVVKYDASDGHNLDPEFLAAMRLLGQRGRVAQFWAERKLPPRTPDMIGASPTVRRAYRILVEAARDFGEMLRGHLADDALFALNSEMIALAEQYRREIIAARK